MSEEIVESSRRARFSLRTLLLATLFLAMALAIVVLTWELIPLRAEVQELRDEAGYLTIEDPTKLHAIWIETESPLMWKWKVYLPPGDGFVQYGTFVGDVPAARDEPEFRSGTGQSPEAQQCTITARFFEDVDKTWKLKATIDQGDGGTSIYYTDVTAQQLGIFSPHGSVSESGVFTHTQSAPVGENLRLLRRTIYPGGGVVTPGEPGTGLVIWIKVNPDSSASSPP